jgi:hypothetical protein
VLNDMLADPSAMAAAAGVLIDQKANHRLAELEAWAVSQPSRRLDPQQEAAELHRTRRARANRESFAMSAWKSSVTDCRHQSCLVGACKYRMAG